MEDTQEVRNKIKSTVEGGGKRKRKERAKDKDMDGTKKGMIEEAIIRYKERCPRVKRITDRALEVIKMEIKREKDTDVTMEELRAVNVWVRQRRNNYLYRERWREVGEAQESEETGAGMEIEGEDQVRRMREEMEVEKAGGEEEREAAEREKEELRENAKRLEAEIERWKEELARSDEKRMVMEMEAKEGSEARLELEKAKKEWNEERATLKAEAKEESETRRGLEKEKQKFNEERKLLESGLQQGKRAREKLEEAKKELDERDLIITRISIEEKKRREREEEIQREKRNLEREKEIVAKQKAIADREMEEVRRQKERMESDRYNRLQEWKWERERMEQALKVAQKEAFIATLWELAETALEPNNRLMIEWQLKVETVWKRCKYRGWQGRLNPEERRKHLVKIHQGRVEYDEGAYRDTPGDLWKMVRNVAAHR